MGEGLGYPSQVLGQGTPLPRRHTPRTGYATGVRLVQSPRRTVLIREYSFNIICIAFLVFFLDSLCVYENFATKVPTVHDDSSKRVSVQVID